MESPVSTILFATNLSENCIPAFDFAGSMATRYEARLLLLHVIEDMPVYVEGRLKGLFGKKEWERIKQTHEDSARQSLTGKRSTSALIRAALDRLCNDAGIEASASHGVCREVVVGHGEIVEEIIAQAEGNGADMIVLGAKEGALLSKVSIGNTIKGVLRAAKVPVMVVPAIKR